MDLQTCQLDYSIDGKASTNGSLPAGSTGGHEHTLPPFRLSALALAFASAAPVARAVSDTALRAVHCISVLDEQISSAQNALAAGVIEARSELKRLSSLNPEKQLRLRPKSIDDARDEIVRAIVAAAKPAEIWTNPFRA